MTTDPTLNPTAVTSRTKVGVFMPCYNLGAYLSESLDSLDAQTFTDFQIVIADDASTDSDTIRALRQVNRERSVVRFEKANLGLVAISNKYMAELDADYIMLFSPDDRMDPRFLEVQVNYLDSHPDVAAVCTSIQCYGESEELIEYADERCRLPEMLVENRFSGAALMRKSAWLAAGMHDPDPALFPNLDYDLWLSMLSRGMTLGTVAEPLFFWRVLHTSLSHAVDAQRMLVFRRALATKYVDLYEAHARFVIDHDLEVIARLEDYHAKTEEAHSWLKEQYHSLSREIERLTDQSPRLRKRRLPSSGRGPGTRLYGLLRGFLRRVRNRIWRH